MAIILSFFTGEQICEECAQHSETRCTKCSPSADDQTCEPTTAERDRLVLDSVAE